MFKVKNYNKSTDAYFIGHEYDLITESLQRGKIWEKWLHDVFDEFVNKDSVVIEGGCHIGSHSLKLGMIAKKVYCFEPLPSSYNLLKQNIENNGIENIILSQKGLSDKIGETSFSWIVDGNIGYAGLYPFVNPKYPKATKEIKVELTTIDELNLDQLDFIKLDVEGYEEMALQGGINSIKKFRPVITVECWKDYNNTVDIQYTYNKYKFLIDLDYKMSHIKDSDFLFVPNEKIKSEQ